MAAKSWECCLNETPECRPFATAEDLIKHLFEIHDQYLCCECHSFVTQSEEEYSAHIVAHQEKSRNDANNNHNNDNNVGSNDESCGTETQRLKEIAGNDKNSNSTRRNVSSNTDSSRPTSSKRDTKKRNKHQSVPSESCSKSYDVDEDSPPILEANSPLVSPPSNNGRSLQPDLSPVSLIQSRSKTLRQFQTRLNSPSTESGKKSMFDEKSTSINVTKSLRKRASPSSDIHEDGNEALTKNKKIMNTISAESTTTTTNQCGDCNKSFKTEQDLGAHLLSHNAVKLESSRSSSGFSLSRSSISEENDISDNINGDSVYCCPVCGKKEYDEKGIFIHFSKNHKNPENRNYGCPNSVRNHVGKLLPCPKIFQNVSQLYQHVKNHDDEQSSQTKSNTPASVPTTTFKPNTLPSKKTGRGRKKKVASSITISPSKTKSTTHNDGNDKNYHPETSDSDDASADERSVRSKNNNNIPSNHHHHDSNIRPRNRRNNIIETPVISQREKPVTKKPIPPIPRVTTNKSLKQFPCGDDCPAQYTDLKALHEHRLKKHPKKTFHVCVECNYIPYSSLSGLQKHQNERH